jgi:hypothetical protein
MSLVRVIASVKSSPQPGSQAGIFVFQQTYRINKLVDTLFELAEVVFGILVFI